MAVARITATHANLVTLTNSLDAKPCPARLTSRLLPKAKVATKGAGVSTLMILPYAVQPNVLQLKLVKAGAPRTGTARAGGKPLAGGVMGTAWLRL